MEALTYERAVELAREVVAEFGEDYVYPEDRKRPEFEGDTKMCQYVWEDKPACFVGQILYRHGVSLAALGANEFTGASVVSFRTADASDKARFFLKSAQQAQDKGRTWGEALNHGLSETTKYYG